MTIKERLQQDFKAIKHYALDNITKKSIILQIIHGISVGILLGIVELGIICFYINSNHFASVLNMLLFLIIIGAILFIAIYSTQNEI